MANLVEKTIGPGPVPVWDLTSVSAGQIESVCGYGRGVNLLDNWYFADPINQRGQTEYTVVGYTIDRWNKDQPGSMRLQSDGIQFTSEPNEIINILQKFEAPSRLSGQTITYSVLAEGTLSIVIGVNNGYPAAQEPTGTEKHLYTCTYTLPNSLSLLQMIIQIKKNSTAKVYAAKLELGSQQTLARQDSDGNWVLNDPPPNKALELLKCQRYFIPEALFQNGASWCFGHLTSGDGLAVSIPAVMRSVPTVTPTTLEIFINGSWQTVSLRSVRLFPTMVVLSYDPSSLAAGWESLIGLSFLLKGLPALDANL